MKRGYAYLSAFSFLVAGNIIEASSGWSWTWKSLVPCLLGYLFMDAYAKRYNE